jgi:hypothetical protein
MGKPFNDVVTAAAHDPRPDVIAAAEQRRMIVEILEAMTFDELVSVGNAVREVYQNGVLARRRKSNEGRLGASRAGSIV